MQKNAVENLMLGHLMNLRGALLVNCHSATHICKDGNCTSLFGTPGIYGTAGAEYLAASSLVGPILNPDDLIS
jgi:hypothetical protein